MNRGEHVKWAQERAAEETAKTSSVGGWFSFKHDMCKHEEIKDDPTMLFLFERGNEICREVIQMTTVSGVRDPLVEQKLTKFIEDFR